MMRKSGAVGRSKSSRYGNTSNASSANIFKAKSGADLLQSESSQDLTRETSNGSFHLGSKVNTTHLPDDMSRTKSMPDKNGRIVFDSMVSDFKVSWESGPTTPTIVQQGAQASKSADRVESTSQSTNLTTSLDRVVEKSVGKKGDALLQKKVDASQRLVDAACDAVNRAQRDLQARLKEEQDVSKEIDALKERAMSDPLSMFKKSKVKANEDVLKGKLEDVRGKVEDARVIVRQREIQLQLAQLEHEDLIRRNSNSSPISSHSKSESVN